MADLIETWLDALATWKASASAGESVSKQNRLADHVWQLSRKIALEPSLRLRIVDLCGPDAEPNERLGAALVRERWDIDGAAQTLVDIVDGSGAALLRPVTMASALGVGTTDVARAAALCLYNIDRGVGNTGGEHFD